MTHFLKCYQWLYRQWYNIVYMGIRDDMPFFEQQRTHLLNILSIPVFSTLPFLSLINLFTKPALGLLNLCTAVAAGFIVYINSSRRFLAWRMLFVCSFVVIYFLEALFFRNGVEFSMLLMIPAGIVLINNKWKYLILGFTVTIAFSYIVYYHNTHFYYEPAMLFRKIFNIAYCLTLFVVMIWYFKNVYLSYHRQIEESKLLLEEQQQQLHWQKQQLERQNNELHTLSESRQRILFILAHDLRNPLSGIEVLSKRAAVATNQKESAPLLELIANTAYRSQLRIQDLLDSYRFSEEGEDMRKRPADMVALLKATLQQLQMKADQKSIQIVTDCPLIPVVALVNSIQISRVIENLVINAIKFSHPGSEVIVALTKQQECFCISVKDNGVGIPEDLRPLIFSSTHDCRRAGTNGEKSVGLGLHICREIVEAHNGAIELANEGVAAGCEFRLRIPLGYEM